MTYFIYLFPLLFAIHNAEEALTIATYGRAAMEQLGADIDLPATEEFAASVALLTLIALAVSHAAARADMRDPKRAGTAYHVWLLVVAIAFGNVFAHVAQALFARGYVPGLATALGLMLPYGIAAFTLGMRAGYLHGLRVATFVIAGLVLQAPVAYMALLIGRLFV